MKTKNLAPEIFFGSLEVPPYRQIGLSGSCEPEDVVAAIHQFTWGENASGYVENATVFFHPAVDDDIMVDLSKEFIFVSQPRSSGGGQPSSWQVLRFLQEPVRKALFIGEDFSLCIEKSGATLKLCGLLDFFWSNELPAEELASALDDESKRERLLSKLMKKFELSQFGETSVMWDFWKEFGLYLMVNSLYLEVTKIVFEPEG